jgi:hypothetical protein
VGVTVAVTVGEPVVETVGVTVAETVGDPAGDAGVVAAGDADVVAAGDVSGEAAGVSEPEPQALRGSKRPITDTTAINLLFIKCLSNTTNGNRFSIEYPYPVNPFIQIHRI